MAVTLSRLSREYVYTFVETPHDLTEAESVEVAFIPNQVDLPEESDWHTATVIPNTINGIEGFDIRILVGPGGEVDLTPPTNSPVDYQEWARITDNPERPVRRIGTVTAE